VRRKDSIPQPLSRYQAVAALESNTMSPSSSVLCTGGYQFGKRIYHDWKASGHGYVDLHKALIQSCDVYFYTIGQRMGIDMMAEYAKDFGLGHETGIELPSERVGSIPSMAWKLKVKKKPGCREKRSLPRSGRGMSR
jgi:penicillin-binding protein 2